MKKTTIKLAGILASAILFIMAFGLLIKYQEAQAYDLPTGAWPNGMARSTSTAIAVDASGVPVTNVPTYSIQVADLTPPATPTDVVCLTGSSTKTIRLERIQATADATGAGMIDFYVYKRTAANTGGTASAVAVTKMDTANAAATASAVTYTANATALGTGTLVAGDHYEIPATTGNSYFAGPWIEDFGIRNSQALTLRGTSEQACFNLNGQALPAGFSMYLRLEWTEE